MGLNRLNVQLPDWRRWLTARGRQAARDASDYELHLAAVEWALSSALDINRREDFLSLPSPAVEPFAHQVDDAILFFRRLAPRGLIADDVGLGKTITAGLVARELLERGRIESILVVCPKALLEQWHEELDSKFGIKAMVAVGGQFTELDRHPFWITSYDTARSKIDAVRARKFDFLILDEGHALRNLFGGQKPPQRAVAFEKLMRDDAVRYCLMLTATPIQNRLWDIFSLLEILRAPQPNPLGRPDEFRARFIADQEARQLRREMQEEFRRRVAEATIRTRRSDTRLLFPDREVRTERLTPTPEERQYIDLALSVILDFPRLVQITHAMTLMSSPWAAAAAFEREAEKPNLTEPRRQQLLLLSQAGRRIRTSAKVERILKLIRTSAGTGAPGRLIVFTRRLETLHHLEQAISEAGYGGLVGIIQGNQPQANTRAIRDFMSDPPVRPILLSTDTGAVGLNLQAGNIVVNYDLPWNPMTVEQRIGRVQRLGQKARHVVVYNLVLAGTIEDHVVLRLMEKLNLFNQAIGEMEELLELCGYDEAQSLEEIIIDLIRKAAERRDIEEDLRRMEASRREAEQKIQEMREATEQALASIKPKDTGARLEGLRRVVPRLGLREMVAGCLKRAGADFREDEQGRLFVRVPGGYEEFVFDRQSRLLGGVPGVRPVLPGTRAFDHVTRDVRERITHHVVDTSGTDLERVQVVIEEALAPAGMVLDEIYPIGQEPVLALRTAVRAAVEIPSDRYETLLEIDRAEASDGIEDYLGSNHLRRADVTGRTARDSILQRIGDGLAAGESEVLETAREDDSVRRFCDFYEQRFQEDLVRLAEHMRRSGHQLRTADEEAIENVAKRDPAIRSAWTALKLRFTPTLKVDPVGATGVLYERVEIGARIRNRLQREGHSITVSTVPLTGVLRTPIPGLSELGESEGWACPGGHVVQASGFVRCRYTGCTVGGCESCLSGRASDVLVECDECEAPRCETHRRACAECGRRLCEAHWREVTGTGTIACSACSVELDDGRRLLSNDVEASAVSGRRAPRAELARSELSGAPAFAEELVVCQESGRRILPGEAARCEVTGKRVARDLLETSAVSGRAALRSRILRSALSGRPCLPGEEALCDETGAVLLPDELGQCSVSGRRARHDLLEENAQTGERALRRLLAKSDVSGKWAQVSTMTRSQLSGRLGLPEETDECSTCHRTTLKDELTECRETGQRACAEHLERCEISGQAVLPNGLERCDVTGRRVRRSLLATCPETGKRGLAELFETCSVSGQRVLPEGLGRSSVTGITARRSLLVPCAVSGRLALPEELATCSVTAKTVHPDLLVTCPETGARFLAGRGVRCEESGALVSRDAVAVCAETGCRVRHSLLEADDVTGQLVIARLLSTCAVTGKRTLVDRLVSSAVSGKRALPDQVLRCAVSGAVTLPGELQVCEVTGKTVLPELLMTCPETGARLLPAYAERCHASGAMVAPSALETCQLTGQRVRRSLLGLDEVEGALVQDRLMRACARTGRRTRPGNLAMSAVSGTQVLSGLMAQCAESGAAALPDELESCELTGKRVLPTMLAKCELSGRRVLKSLLKPCEVSGRRVLPEFLAQCRRSGRTALTSLLANSEVSGEPGLAELLIPCSVTGRKGFPDEMVTVEVTGQRITKDRVMSCWACGRTADRDALRRCGACEQTSCPADQRGDLCVVCVHALSRTAGRELDADEVLAARRARAWARRGWVAEGRAGHHVVIESSGWSFRHQAWLVVLPRSRPGGLRDFATAVAEKPITRDLLRYAREEVEAA